MNPLKPETTEEFLISILSKASHTGTDLLVKIRETKPRFTKQALYVVLRKLLQQEILVKHGTQFSLSRIWLGKMAVFFTTAQERYGVKSIGTDFLSLADGDSISYNYRSPEEADNFWGHAFDVLSEHASKSEPIYIYNPHEWFVFARQESELFLFEKIKSQKKNLWLTAGSNEPLDRYARKFFDGTYLQYHITEKPIFDKTNYYVNIFGDFIIEAYIDQTAADAVQHFYTNTTEWNDQIIPYLKTLISKGKTKVTISHNSRKAAKLKKILGGYFYKA